MRAASRSTLIWDAPPPSIVIVCYLYVMASLLPVSLLSVCMVLSNVLKLG